MGDWHNIATQDDIESLLSAYGDFHDACIVEAHFKSGAFVDEASAMHFGSANEYILSLIFQCQWTPQTIELQFIGLRQFHLAGWQENYACNIFDVYLAFHDDLLPLRIRMWFQTLCDGVLLMNNNIGRAAREVREYTS